MSNVALNNAVNTAQLNNIDVVGTLSVNSSPARENTKELIAVHPFGAWRNENAGQAKTYALGKPSDAVRVSVTGNPFIVMRNPAKNYNPSVFCSKRVKDTILASLELGEAVTVQDVIDRFDLAYTKSIKNELNKQTGAWEPLKEANGEYVYEYKYMIVSRQTSLEESDEFVYN